MRGSPAVVLSGCGRAHAPVADQTACDPLRVSLCAMRRFVSCGSLGEREMLSIMSPFTPCLPCRRSLVSDVRVVCVQLEVETTAGGGDDTKRRAERAEAGSPCAMQREAEDTELFWFRTTLCFTCRSLGSLQGSRILPDQHLTKKSFGCAKAM